MLDARPDPISKQLGLIPDARCQARSQMLDARPDPRSKQLGQILDPSSQARSQMLDAGPDPRSKQQGQTPDAICQARSQIQAARPDPRCLRLGQILDLSIQARSQMVDATLYVRWQSLSSVLGEWVNFTRSCSPLLCCQLKKTSQEYEQVSLWSNTIADSETELNERMNMVTPTTTGTPERRRHLL